jgi:hypothetical protein
MNPLMGFALAHPEQPPLHDLQGIGLQVDQEKQQPIRGGRQRAILVRGVAAGRARLPIEAPCGYMRLERGRKGRDYLLKRLQRETGHFEYLCRPGLEVDEP